MRKDFNKLLTESARLGNKWKFSDVRNCKGNAFDEDEIGGKRSIHAARRNARVQRRQFNENLNTLRRFIAANVGRPWNKIYSEICQNFDKRKVINDHILVHLFQDVETQAKMVNGEVCVLNNYRERAKKNLYDPNTNRYVSVANDEGYYERRWTPIGVSTSLARWYVHPVDGLLKEIRRKSASAIAREREQQYKQQKNSIFRKISEFEELHLEDGVWYVYSLKQKPEKVLTFGVPGREYAFAEDLIFFKMHTRWYYAEPVLEDAINRPKNNATNNSNLYYFKKQTASKKLLKSMGLSGYVVDQKQNSQNQATFSPLRRSA